MWGKAVKILKKYHFIYELSEHGNLIAEPMDFSISGKIISELQKAGYFILSANRERIILTKAEPV